MQTRTFPGFIKRWVDADTVDINIDLGFKVWSVQRFRLFEINTPERKQPGFEESVARVNALAPVESSVDVTCYGYDRYGRWIADVIPVGSTRGVSKILLEENLAVPYKG